MIFLISSNYYRSNYFFIRNEEIYDKIEFTNFNPYIFAKIRKMSDLDEEVFLESVGIKSLTSDILLGGINPMSLMGSTGKSGSFFFYSSNNEYLIKAIPKREVESLLRILKGYVNHLETHPGSLITRFFGLYKLKLLKNKKNKRELYVCVMNNVISGKDAPDTIYDLKGSLFKRKKGPNEPSNAPFKDIDWLEHNRKLLLPDLENNKLLKLIKNDCQFLKTNNLLDYSILIGISSKISPHGLKPDNQRVREIKIKNASGVGNNSRFWEINDAPDFISVSQIIISIGCV